MYDADGLTLAHEWHGEARTRGARCGGLGDDVRRVFHEVGVGGDVLDLHGPLLVHSSSGDAFRPHLERTRPHLVESPQQGGASFRLIRVAITAPEGCELVSAVAG